MRRHTIQRAGGYVVLLAAVGLVGCAQPSGGGGGTADGNVNDNTGGQVTVTDSGFEDSGLAAPTQLPAGVDNVPPTGGVIFPPAGVTVAAGEVIFVWESADQDETNLDNTVYISDQPAVFDDPLATPGTRTSPDEAEHRLSVQVLGAGTLYWGVEITDGVNTIRRPADEVGVEFEVSKSLFSRIGAEDAILLCPREGLPARAVTTFKWSLGEIEPLRTQIFVSRAGLDNPFESPLRVFEVDPPTATAWPISEDDALPAGGALSWGLRFETAEQVQFTFEGQLGVSFVVEQNVPPSGQLLGPDNDSPVPDGAVPDLAWAADPGNCEDELTLTLGFEHLGQGTEPMDLFGSDYQLTVQSDSAEADLIAQLTELDFQGGRWAWGVQANDGTDTTTLPDADDPERSFRTFIRNTSPEFVDGPGIAPETCGLDTVSHDALVFSYADADGTDTVEVTLHFAATEAGVFADGAQTMALSGAGAGDSVATVTVFVVSPNATGCTEFVQGTGFYGVELDDGVNDPVRSTVAYTGQATGACCAADGSCSDVTADECTVGEYQGDGTTCQDVLCAVPTGACCLPSGACTEGTAAECTGTYQGDGTTCDLVTCTPQITDCNANGVDDAQDIAQGTSNDCDLNGVPDECEGVGDLVDAGTLASGTVAVGGAYDSAANNNNLNGRVCPVTGTPTVRWDYESGPLGVEVFITNPVFLSTGYLISPAMPGDYVFRLTWIDKNISDTVTLTLQAP